MSVEVLKLQWFVHCPKSGEKTPVSECSECSFLDVVDYGRGIVYCKFEFEEE